MLGSWVRAPAGSRKAIFLKKIAFFIRGSHLRLPPRRNPNRPAGDDGGSSVRLDFSNPTFEPRRIHQKARRSCRSPGLFGSSGQRAPASTRISAAPAERRNSGNRKKQDLAHASPHRIAAAGTAPVTHPRRRPWPSSGRRCRAATRTWCNKARPRPSKPDGCRSRRAADRPSRSPAPAPPTRGR